MTAKEALERSKEYNFRIYHNLIVSTSAKGETEFMCETAMLPTTRETLETLGYRLTFQTSVWIVSWAE